MSNCECGSGPGPEDPSVADLAARATCLASCPRASAGVDRGYQGFEVGLPGQLGVQALQPLCGLQHERRCVAASSQRERDLRPHPLHPRLTEFARRSELSRYQKSLRGLEIPGCVLRLGRRQSPCGALAGVRSEHHRSLPEGRGGGYPASAQGAAGRVDELPGHRLVGPGRRVGAVPCPAVGVGHRIGCCGQRLVYGSAIIGGGGPVGGRTHQRMPEAHVRTELQQVSRGNQVHGSGIQAEYPGGPEDQRRVADRIGRREQDQPLDLVRQLTQARCVLIFDAAGQISRVRKSEPAGEAGGAPASVELEQGQRMAAYLCENPAADVLVERTRDNRRQQRPSRLLIQPAQPEFGQTRQVIRRGASCGRRTDREHQPYRLRQQAAPDESKDLGRGLVEPLRVVHDAQHQLLLRGLRHEAEHREGDQESVGAITGGKPERDAEPATLRLGQRPEPAEHRRTQLMQPGEGQLHLRLDADHAGHRETGRFGDQMSQQFRLADPRLSPHD